MPSIAARAREAIFLIAFIVNFSFQPYEAVTAPLIWPLIRYLPMKM